MSGVYLSVCPADLPGRSLTISLKQLVWALVRATVPEHESVFAMFCM